MCRVVLFCGRQCRHVLRGTNSIPGRGRHCSVANGATFDVARGELEESQVPGIRSHEMGQSQSAGDRSASSQRHAFNYVLAALRIFRFAADTAPRVLQLAHVSAFMRECAVEFGSVDATLPGAMRSEYASGRYFKLRAAVERNAVRCRWLAVKLLACLGGAPMPAAALAPDVTRHDVKCHGPGFTSRTGVALDGRSLARAARRS